MLACKTAVIRAYLVCVSVSAVSWSVASSKAAGGGARGWGGWVGGGVWSDHTNPAKVRTQYRRPQGVCPLLPPP